MKLRKKNLNNNVKHAYLKGVGEGGGGVGGHVPPHFQKWGAQVGLWPPPHFWAEQMFYFHYFHIFCG